MKTLDRARPLRLRSDNFTPPTRTPWGGRRIVAEYKAALGVAAADTIVGESWEVSVEPSFPSRVADDDRLLAEVIRADAEAWLGARVARTHGGQTPLLLKLIDAAEALSVQVHPTEGDPALEPGESGKPEAWIILARHPGAGLFLGFREGVERTDVEACLREGGALDALMNFVPVEVGDAFVIDAGTPHAIGAGVTLFEPQFVTPDRKGVTYRFWDWNRRYDRAGRPDPSGAPRELHVERSLAVTRWSGPRGEGFVEMCRGGVRSITAGAMSRDALIDWRWFTTERWSGTGPLDVEAAGTLVGITCVAGTLAVTSETGELVLRGGESGVVPAVAGRLAVRGDHALAFATRSAP